MILDSVGSMLGGDFSKGVFVRSDTNVEDLPQFSGAGLNLTVAHQTSADAVLASVATGAIIGLVVGALVAD